MQKTLNDKQSTAVDCDICCTYVILRIKWIIHHECELLVNFVEIVKNLRRLTAPLFAFNASKFNLFQFCKLRMNFK